MAEKLMYNTDNKKKSAAKKLLNDMASGFNSYLSHRIIDRFTRILK